MMVRGSSSRIGGFSTSGGVVGAGLWFFVGKKVLGVLVAGCGLGSHWGYWRFATISGSGSRQTCLLRASYEGY